MGRTLLAEFQKPQQSLNCEREDFIVRFEMKLKTKAPVESLDKSARKPIAGLPKISGKIWLMWTLIYYLIIIIW